MASQATSVLCPEQKLSSFLAQMKSGGNQGMRDLDTLLRDYPGDPRLHFLRGSFLAGEQDYGGARTAMRRAVELAPDYAIARFQLGLLLLTSGDAIAAQEAWGPLHSLPSAHYLRLFVTGLTHMIRDEFDDTVRLLQEGIAANAENPPLNRDMQMVIEEVRARPAAASGGGAVSSVDFLLQQAALKATRH